MVHANNRIVNSLQLCAILLMAENFFFINFAYSDTYEKQSITQTVCGNRVFSWTVGIKVEVVGGQNTIYVEETSETLERGDFCGVVGEMDYGSGPTGSFQKLILTTNFGEKIELDKSQYTVGAKSITGIKTEHKWDKYSWTFEWPDVEIVGICEMPLKYDGNKDVYKKWLKSLKESVGDIDFSHEEWQLMESTSLNSYASSLEYLNESDKKEQAKLWNNYFETYGPEGKLLLQRALAIGANIGYDSFYNPFRNYEIDEEEFGSKAPVLKFENAKGLFKGSQSLLEDTEISEEQWKHYDKIFQRRFNELKKTGKSDADIYYALHEANDPETKTEEIFTNILPKTIIKDVADIQFKEAIENEENDDYNKLLRDGWRIERSDYTIYESSRIDTKNKIIYIDGDNFSDKGVKNLFKELDNASKVFKEEAVLDAYIKKYTADKDIQYLSFMNADKYIFYPAQKTFFNPYIFGSSNLDTDEKAIRIQWDLSPEEAADELHEQLDDLHGAAMAKTIVALENLVLGRYAEMHMDDNEKKERERRLAEASAAFGNAQNFAEIEILSTCAGLIPVKAPIKLAELIGNTVKKAKRSLPRLKRLKYAEDVLKSLPETPADFKLTKQMEDAIMDAHNAEGLNNKTAILKALKNSKGEKLFSPAQRRALIENYVCGDLGKSVRSTISLDDIPKELKSLRELYKNKKISDNDLFDLIYDFDRTLFKGRQHQKALRGDKIIDMVTENTTDRLYKQVGRLPGETQHELRNYIKKSLKSDVIKNFSGKDFNKIDGRSLGFGTVPKQMTNNARKGEMLQSFKDYFRDSKIKSKYLDQTIEADHIVPVAEIFNMPGFGDLLPASQKLILHNRKNFQSLPKFLNGVKSNLSIGAWNQRMIDMGYGALPNKYVHDLIQKEDDIRRILANQIKELR